MVIGLLFCLGFAFFITNKSEPFGFCTKFFGAKFKSFYVHGWLFLFLRDFDRLFRSTWVRGRSNRVGRPGLPGQMLQVLPQALHLRRCPPWAMESELQQGESMSIFIA